MRRIFVILIILTIGLVSLMVFSQHPAIFGSSEIYAQKALARTRSNIEIEKTILPVLGGFENITATFVGNTNPTLFSGSPAQIMGENGKIFTEDDVTVSNIIYPFTPELATNLFYAGFDTFSLPNLGFINSNNQEIINSLQTASNLKIPHLGIGLDDKESKKMQVYEKGDVSLGLFSFSDISNEDAEEMEVFQYINRTRRTDFFKSIEDASELVDALVVILHVKDSGENHTYRNELLSREIIDRGADLVVIMGPKNIFDIEKYHEKYVAYSLGNFLLKDTKEENRKGLALQIVVDENGVASVDEYLVSHTPKPEITSVSLIGDLNSESVESSYMRILGNRRYLYKQLSVYEKSSKGFGRVAITIDDGYDVENVEKAINIFKNENAVATFFPIAEQLNLYPSVWKKAVASGIEFGNHTKTHPWITHISASDFKKEIDDANIAIKKINPKAKINFFRPPYKDGFTSDSWLPNTHVDILKKSGLKVSLWSVDSYRDEYLLNEDPSIEQIVDAVVSNAKDGSIILIHFDDRDIEALPYIIKALRAKGLKLVTLSELLGF